MRRLIEDRGERERLAARSACACVERFTGALDRTLDALEPYLASSRPCAMKLPRAPDFWWRRHSVAGWALAPVGALYGADRRPSAWRGAGVSVGVPVHLRRQSRHRRRRQDADRARGRERLPQAAAQSGLSDARLSRHARPGRSVVSPAVHTPRDVGDEALLLAQFAPTVVAVDRPSGAKLLASLGVNVVVMDDGFQNPSLTKDLALVVVDAERGIGNGFVFPAGPLRAPLAAQIRIADALVVLGEGTAARASGWRRAPDARCLRAQIEPVRRRGLKRRPYLAFAGIADPAKFYAALAAAGAHDRPSR